jgi:hypothetical protein
MTTQFVDMKIVDEEESASQESFPVGHTYCWKLFRKSWSISASRPKSLKRILKQPHAKVSFGFWFRVTVDEYVPQPLQAAPVRPWESCSEIFRISTDTRLDCEPLPASGIPAVQNFKANAGNDI